jgi:hypothetical protein
MAAVVIGTALASMQAMTMLGDNWLFVSAVGCNEAIVHHRHFYRAVSCHRDVDFVLLAEPR